MCRRWTYAQLLAEAERAAWALTARFAPGERVAAWAPDRKQPPHGGQQPAGPRGPAAGVALDLGEYGECR
jgi:acyl-CoA synthetase (AMP-forming)/AMP-acid ligase II